MFKKISILIMIIFLITQPLCHADQIDVVFDKTDRKISLAGQLGGQYANSRITAVLIHSDSALPNLTEEDFENGAGGIIGNVAGIMQKTSDSSGNYHFEDFTTEISGYITISVSAEKMAAPVTTQLFIPEEGAVDSFVQKAKNKQMTKELLNAEAETPTFGADMYFYKQLSDTESMKTVAKNINNNFERYSGDDAISNLDDDVFMYSFLAYLTESKNSEELAALLDVDSADYSLVRRNRIKSLLKLEELCQSSTFKFLKENASLQNPVMNLACAKKMYTPGEFTDAIHISTINYRLSTVNGWRDAYSILSDHSDVLTGMSGDKLDDNESNKEMMTDIIETPHTGVSALCDFVNDWKPKSGGSGGGGGGGGSLREDKITVTTPEKENPKQETAPVSFNDLGGYEWAKEAVLSLSERGIINGYGNKKFNPGGNVTREEFVKMITNALDIEKGDEDVVFSDAEPRAWYYDPICKAYSAGIITGLDDGTFGIGRSIVRQDMAVILSRAIAYKNWGSEIPDTNVPFADAEKISEYAKEHIAFLYNAKVVSGQGNNLFAPGNYMTRAEAAVVIYNTLNAFALQ